MAYILSVFSCFINILHFNYLQTDEVPAELTESRLHLSPPLMIRK